MSEHLADPILPYEEILAEARCARDPGESMSSITHALCAIGLELIQTRDMLVAILEELTERKEEG